MNGETKFFIGVVLAAVLAVAGIVVFTKTKPAPSEPDLALAQIRGETNQVTIVEFGDFQCPACAAASAPLKAAIEANTDSVRLAYIHFPLPSHPNAEPAGWAAEAAALQGKFWEMHDLLFTRQESWSGLTDPAETFAAFAQELELNAEQFKTDYNSSAVKARVDAGRSHGNALKVNQTPTFFVNGEMVTGVRTQEQWQEIIDQAKQAAADAAGGN